MILLEKNTFLTWTSPLYLVCWDVFCGRILRLLTRLKAVALHWNLIRKKCRPLLMINVIRLQSRKTRQIGEPDSLIYEHPIRLKITSFQQGGTKYYKQWSKVAWIMHDFFCQTTKSNILCRCLYWDILVSNFLLCFVKLFSFIRYMWIK